MVRLAVIGVGRMGSVHARNIYKNRVKGGRLTAICDIDQGALDSFTSKYNKVKTYLSHKELISSGEVDAVIIATPHYAHPDIAIDCIKAGLHILVEKPIAVEGLEAERIIAAAKDRSDLKFSVMYNQRTNRMYKLAKRIISKGGLGEIRRINFIITDWYRSQAYYNQGGWRASWKGEGGGALINQCIHQLDILQWLTGMPAKILAQCNTRNRNITVENEVTAIFTYANGARGTFTAATNELIGTNRLEIAGDKGRLVIDRLKARYIKFNKSEPEVNRDTAKGYGFTMFRIEKFGYGLINLIKDITIGQQINIIKNFVKSIEGKEELIARGEEGVNALALINAIYLSAYQGKEVDLPLDNKEYNKFLNECIDKECKGDKV